MHPANSYLIKCAVLNGSKLSRARHCCPQSLPSACLCTDCCGPNLSRRSDSDSTLFTCYPSNSSCLQFLLTLHVIQPDKHTWRLYHVQGAGPGPRDMGRRRCAIPRSAHRPRSQDVVPSPVWVSSASSYLWFQPRGVSHLDPSCGIQGG